MVIVRTRSTDPCQAARYHIASHFLQNCLHMGQQVLDATTAGARECVWKRLQVFQTSGEYMLNHGTPLTNIPVILRSVHPLSVTSLACAQLFVRDFFAGHGFLFHFCFHSTPSIEYDALCSAPRWSTHIFLGRRHYKSTQCPRRCPCRWDVYRLDRSKPIDPSHIPCIVPSIVDETMKVLCRSIENHLRIAPRALFLDDMC